MSERVPVEIAWPEDAEDVEEGVVVNWFVREGAAVRDGETIGEVQIEKVGIDVDAPVAGTVAEIAVEEDATFARGDPLGWIEPE
ncbi:MAG: lipoyl domain-containing protein [Halobacteriales archaeon]